MLPNCTTLASDLYDEVASLGGTISAQHGDGIARSWFSRKHAGDLFGVWQQVKAAIDPQRVFNPHKVADNDLIRPTQNLRRVSGQQFRKAQGPDATADDTNNAPSAPIELLLNWDEQAIENTIRACNGCWRMPHPV